MQESAKPRKNLLSEATIKVVPERSVQQKPRKQLDPEGQAHPSRQDSHGSKNIIKIPALPAKQDLGERENTLDREKRENEAAISLPLWRIRPERPKCESGCSATPS